ncbi:MAG: phosphoribosylamine--glycine ligase [Pseudomonadota bacterium]
MHWDPPVSGTRNVLLLGSGGREHALAWKFRSSPLAGRIFVAPGNAGMARDKGLLPVPMNPSDFGEVARFCRTEKIDFVMVGPEEPLARGVVDHLRKEGVPVLGPSRSAARLEASKSFAKELMRELSIPTADFGVFHCPEEAADFLEKQAWSDGAVVKVDGLAAGKGVAVCSTTPEAVQAVRDFMVGKKLGFNAETVVVERVLHGREVSAFALCDGRTFLELGFACDHKRLLDGNRGPNTGGMGAYSPVSWLTEPMRRRISDTVFLPLISHMVKIGDPFTGILFAGLMIAEPGPFVLEFNVRAGDPETQAQIPLIEADFLDLCIRAAEGHLEGRRITLRTGACVHVVMAARGYPGLDGPVRKGDEILLRSSDTGRKEEDWKIFFAGVGRSPSGNLLTAGGRVLGVSAWGASLAEAREKAYGCVDRIRFEGSHFRRDIGVV